jgi:hypothetical protein
MSFPLELLKALALFLGRHARAQDSQDIIVTLRVGNDDHATPDRADRYESILLVGVFLIVYFQVVDVVLEKLGGFLEGQAMLCPIGFVLGWIPLESHGTR